MNDSKAKPRYVIAGGSGFLGFSLARHLAGRGAEVVVLSRKPPKVSGSWTHRCWDARTVGDWQSVLDGASGLVNLTGRTVDCIKTPNHCDEILRSRVESTLVLGQAMRNIAAPPPVWVQMSTAHTYGDPPEAVCDEDSPFGFGLAPFVGRAWEEAFHNSLLPSQRGVVLRTSFVLGRDEGAGCGAMSRLRFLAKLGLCGTIGTGKQGISWIHQTDLNHLIEAALMDDSMNGTYVASAPNPVSQREFMRELRLAMGVPIGLPAFEWMVRLGAHYVFRTDPELILYGRYVVSKRLRERNFPFQFAHLPAALADLFR